MAEPRVLNEALYNLYGGWRVDVVTERLNLAITLGERLVERYMGTFLFPTTVTGTYTASPDGKIDLDHGEIREILSVSHVSDTKTQDAEYRILDAEYGLIFVV